MKIKHNMKYRQLTTIRLSESCKVFWALLATLILMNSCATKDIVREWDSGKDYEQNIDRILIMGLVNLLSLRNDVEYDMVDAANKFGSSTIIVAIEAIKQEDGLHYAYYDSGREPSGREVSAWAAEAGALGAGEILLTSVDREGTGQGLFPGL